VRLAIVAAEPVIRNAVAVVAAALLPVAVLRLPTMGTITLPSDLLLMCLSWASLLCGPVFLLLTLLNLLPSGLLLSRGIVLLLTLLALLVLLPSGLLLILFRGVVLLLLLLALLILLPPGLLLVLLCRIVLLCRFGLLLPLFLVLRFILLVLACVGRNSPSEKQKHS